MDSLKRPAPALGPFHIRSTHIYAFLAEYAGEHATKNAPQSQKRGNYLRREPRCTDHHNAERNVVRSPLVVDLGSDSGEEKRHADRMQASAAKTRMRIAHSLVCYLVMSVVANQSEPPTILDANTAQHTAKPSINGSDLIIRVTPCSPWFRRISLQRLWIVP